ncbi:hypothetical protein [Xanthocytophaga flava]|nr:hypothetical protein [Xanthocytophaga flavus]MDJ1470348.1 hypothetical protein [Xanthocytophaga flavus]
MERLKKEEGVNPTRIQVDNRWSVYAPLNLFPKRWTNGQRIVSDPLTMG